MSTLRDRQTTQINRMDSGLCVGQLRDILPVGAGIYGVVIYRIFVAIDAPLQRIARDRGLQRNAAVRH